ncbi:Protein CBG14032 [Caenorhabditis briggsae]|uniref:Histone-lysine N-methyltransferase, H3 lysine-79 specific n=1 Tax=Caenorhabditis briggsae TaxID=6238 RepID=A8XJ78_CAEBR|nr:Protein CBG14032 [Caenorhabditis briggsae]CAP32703.2 Protein CBG14032 [Caenorhabditis briggsae]
MSSQSTTIAAPIVPLPLVVARLYSVYVKGEYMDFLLNDDHQKSGLVLLITSQMAPVLHILGLEAPSLNMPSRDLVDSVNDLNTLVSDFHRNAPNYSFGDFSLDYCTTDTLLAILEISKRCADVGSLRGGATGAKVFGNLSVRQIAVTCGELNIGEKDRFIDIGCGYGQLMCTVAALTQAEMSTGIEYQKHIYDAGVLHLQFFKNLMKFFGKRHGNIKIEYGDVTEEKNHSMVTSSTFIFANNIAFRDLNDQLKKIFLNCRNSTQIVNELFKICKVRSVKEKQLEVVKKNTDWKTKSTVLYLITINRKVLEKENEPVEKMEYEEAASGNVQNNTVPMDVVYRGNEKKKDDCGRKSTRIARRPFSVKYKTQKVQKSKRIPPQKPIKLRKPACETMVPCQNECCITKMKFSKKAGRYQFVLHAFIHSENQFDTFWDCNVCGFRCGSFQRCRDHYKNHHRGTLRTGYNISRLLQTFPKYKDHFAACFGDHIEL